ncbi:MAG: class I SAM-dependent methyltransferase [Gammaproteobacteria bacterium]|nr:class I SAM-dependent methyltransferase [Gammaproteobacteria bacterium]
MQRIPEPEELMDDPAQALAYARADFTEANSLFVELVERQSDDGLHGLLLDLGCGPADIPILLAHRHAGLQIDAVDGATAMLDLARQNIARDHVAGERIRLKCDYLPCPDLERNGYTHVVSNSLLHHLADPMVMWDTVLHCAAPGASVVVMDLARPHSVVAVEALVESYALSEAEVLRRDFRNSLLAAYTVEEVREQLEAAELGGLDVQMVSDRHLAIIGRVS